MRRPGSRSAVAIGLVASLVLALLVASSMLPATGQPTKPEANRFAPSGVVDVDPDAAATAGATAWAQAATADAAGGGSVPAPSGSGTSGCNDIDDGNVRVNQECTNQSEAAFLGRGQGQNETALAVNPKNPRHLLAGQNDYRRGDGACGADWSYDGGPSLGQRAGPSQLHRARSPRLAPAPACSSATAWAWPWGRTGSPIRSGPTPATRSSPPAPAMMSGSWSPPARAPTSTPDRSAGNSASQPADCEKRLSHKR
jgi:hypothetical protein